MFERHAQNHSSGRYGPPGTPRGHDGAGAVIARIVVPAVCFAISALATRFWWRVPFIGPGQRPPWMHNEDADMADAGAGVDAATAAGARGVAEASEGGAPSDEGEDIDEAHGGVAKASRPSKV